MTAEELVGEQDYQEILEDIREECEKYGGVESLRIPRPGKRKSMREGVSFCLLHHPSLAKREAKWNPGETAGQQKAHYDVSPAEVVDSRSLRSQGTFQLQKIDEDAGVGKVWVLFNDINGAVSLCLSVLGSGRR